MASISCQKSLMLVMFMVVIGEAQAGPSNIVRRQVDTFDINDPDLIACLTAQAEGRPCNILNDVEEAPGCSCVHINQCLDNKNPTTPQVDGGSEKNQASQDGVGSDIECLVNPKNQIVTSPQVDGGSEKNPTSEDGVGSDIKCLVNPKNQIVNVRTSCPDTFQTCCTNIADTTVAPPPAPTQPPPSQCGKLNKAGVDLTFVGFEDSQAQFGQFPWMAAVMNTGTADTEGANSYVCGASLIHPKVVLTAAHSIDKYGAQQLAIRLGEYNLNSTLEHIPHQDIRVQQILTHPKYNPTKLAYDVALLFLEKEAIIGRTVNTICLPNPSESFDGATCYSSGWGKHKFSESARFSEVLKGLTLPVINHETCQNVFRSTKLGKQFLLDKTFICAGGNGTIDTCTGDGGSPLVCPLNGDSTRYVQAGVVAWGIGCGTDGIPGAYASVSQTVGWIGEQLLSKMGIDIRATDPKKR